jgi:hypothetical protein
MDDASAAVHVLDFVRPHVNVARILGFPLWLVPAWGFSIARFSFVFA